MTELNFEVALIFGLTLVIIALGYTILRLLKGGGRFAVKEHNTKALDKANLASLYYSAVARQLANELISRDPDYYAINFIALRNRWKEIAADEKLCQITHDEIAHRKPQNYHFDLVEAWDYVTPSFALEGYTKEEIWKAYEDLKLITATQSVLHLSGYNAGLDDDSLKHLKPYLTTLRNTEFVAEMEAAETTYRDIQKCCDDPELSASKMDCTRYTFEVLAPRGFGFQIGVYIRRLDAYGIIEYYDNTVTYYQSDALFEGQEGVGFYENTLYHARRGELRATRQI